VQIRCYGVSRGQHVAITDWKLYRLLILEQINIAMKLFERRHRDILVNICQTPSNKTNECLYNSKKTVTAYLQSCLIQGMTESQTNLSSFWSARYAESLLFVGIRLWVRKSRTMALENLDSDNNSRPKIRL